jgi:hypothetical protein
MKSLIIILILFPFALFSQAFREVYTTKIILNQNENNNNNLFIVQAPSNLNQSVTFTIPVGQGQNGDILTTNGINSTGWEAVAGGQVGGEGNGLIQFNNNGFGGTSNLFWDNDNGFLGVGVSNPQHSLHTSGTILVGSIGNPAVLAIASPNSPNNYLYIRTSNVSNSSVNFTLPVDNGSSNQGLLTNSAGVMSWGGEIKKGPVSNNEPEGNSVVNGATNAYIGGGTNSNITNSAQNSGIYGGNDNDITNAAQSTGFLGGSSNRITNTAHYSVMLGGSNNQITNSTRSLALVGGSNNYISNTAHYSFLGAGANNYIDNNANSMVIMAGQNNRITNSAANFFIGAGGGSVANDGNRTTHSTNNSGIFSGRANNTANAGLRWAIFGGDNNIINNNSQNMFIGGGASNRVRGNNGFVLSGSNLNMSGGTPNASGLIWGENLTISNGCQFSFAGGVDLTINNTCNDVILLGYNLSNSWPNGCVLFGDEGTTTLSGGAANQFRARFRNGYRLWTNSTSTVGVSIDGGGNAWASASDINLKENILTLNPISFLNKIKQLDVFSWSYKGYEETGIRNYGPMAQDFFSLFGKDEIGNFGDDKSIKELDASAILILGVQGASEEIESQTEKLKEIKSTSSTIDNKIRGLEEKLEKISN